MSKYRKPFLKVLGPLWERRFPTWRPGVRSPCFWARPEATFSDDTAFESTGRIFHAVLDFSTKSKWPGAFTADILITSSREGFPPDGNPPRRWSDHIPELLEGSYRIGHFHHGKDCWWHLVDEVAEAQRFWAGIPSMASKPVWQRRREHHWYAPSYDRPFAEIIAAAAGDFCDVFEQHVLPKLQRGTGCS